MKRFSTSLRLLSLMLVFLLVTTPIGNSLALAEGGGTDPVQPAAETGTETEPGGTGDQTEPEGGTDSTDPTEPEGEGTGTGTKTLIEVRSLSSSTTYTGKSVSCVGWSDVEKTFGPNLTEAKIGDQKLSSGPWAYSLYDDDVENPAFNVEPNIPDDTYLNNVGEKVRFDLKLAYITPEVEDRYEFKFIPDGYLSLTPADLEIIVNSEPRTYNGNTQYPTYDIKINGVLKHDNVPAGTYDLLGSGEKLTINQPGGIVGITGAEGKVYTLDAGDYTLVQNATDGNNNYNVTTTSGTLTVTPASAVKVTSKDHLDLVYNGEAYTAPKEDFTVEHEGGVEFLGGENGKYQYKLTATGDTLTIISTVDQAKATGEEGVKNSFKVEFPARGNYESVSDDNFGTLKIAKAALVIKTNDVNATFNGEAHSDPTITVTLNDVSIADEADGLADGVYPLYGEDRVGVTHHEKSAKFVTDSMVDGNSFDVDLSNLSEDNYAVSKDMGDLAISQAQVTVTSLSPDEAFVYNGEAHTYPKYTIAVTGEEPFTVEDIGTHDLPYGGTVTISEPASVTDYTEGTDNTFIAELSDEVNYALTEEENAQLKVDQAQIVVKPQAVEWYYNGVSLSEQNFTADELYSVELNGEPLVGTRQFEGNKLTSVTYDLFGGAKLQVTIPSETAEITDVKKNAETGETESYAFDFDAEIVDGDADNYSIDDTAQNSITVLPADAITVSSEAEEKVYDGAPLKAEYTVENAEGEITADEQGVYTLTAQGKTYTLTIENKTEVTDVAEAVQDAFTVVIKDENQNIVTANFAIDDSDRAMLKVNPLVINVKSDTGEKTYNGEKQRLAKYEYSYGEYSGKIEIPSGSDFSTPVELEIGEGAYLTISGPRDATNVFTNINGFTAEITDAHGYTHAKAGNYTIDKKPGTLKIVPAKITITSSSEEWEYDGFAYGDRTDVKRSYTVQIGDGDAQTLSAGEAINAYGSELTITTDTDTLKLMYADDDGKHKFMTSLDDNNNFDITKVESDIVINPSQTELVLTSLPKTWEYDGEAHTYEEYEVSLNDSETLYNGDVVTFENAASITNFAESGKENNTFSYKIFNGDRDVTDSYANVTKEYGDLAITKAHIVITSVGDSWEYDGETYAEKRSAAERKYNVKVGTNGTIKEYSIENAISLFAQDELTITTDPDTLNAREADTYAHKFAAEVTKGADNYEIQPITGTSYGALTISQSTKVVVVESGSKTDLVYNAKPQSHPVYTVTYGDWSKSLTFAEDQTEAIVELPTGDALTISEPYAPTNVSETAGKEKNNDFKVELGNENSYAESVSKDCGTLTINPVSITLGSVGNTFSYDGTHHYESKYYYYFGTAQELACDEDKAYELENGEILIFSNTTDKNAVKDVGDEHEAKFTFMISGVEEGNITNYNVNKGVGTLKVAPSAVKVVVSSKNVEWTYNGDDYSEQTHITAGERYEVLFGGKAIELTPFYDAEGNIIGATGELHADDVITIKAADEANKATDVAENGYANDFTYEITTSTAGNYDEENMVTKGDVGKLTVKKAPIVTITSQTTEWVYNGKEYNAQDIELKDRYTVQLGDEQATLGEDGKWLLSTGDKVSITSTTNVVTVADTKEGNNTFTYELEKAGNYEGVEPVYGKLTVKKAPLKIESSDVEWTYDGDTYAEREDIVKTYTVTYGDGKDQVVVKDVQAGDLNLFGEDKLTITSTSDAKKFVADDGKHSFDVSVDEANNYQEVPEKVFGDLTIKPTQIEVVMTSEGQTWEYDGEAHSHPVYKVAFDAFEKNLTDVGTVTLPTGDVLTIKTPASVTNVLDTTESTADNTFEYELANETTEDAEGNAVANYTTVTRVYGDLVITPAPLTITSPDAEWVYNGQTYGAQTEKDGDHTYTVKFGTADEEIGKKTATGKIDAKGKVTISLYAGDTVAITSDPAAMNVKNVADTETKHTFTYGVVEASNYEVVAEAFGIGVLKVNKAPKVVIESLNNPEWIYNGMDYSQQEFTADQRYAVTLLDEAGATVETVTLTRTADGQGATGTIEHTGGSVTINADRNASNVKFVAHSGTLNAFAYTLSDEFAQNAAGEQVSNYVEVDADNYGTLTVQKAPLVQVTSQTGEWEYNGLEYNKQKFGLTDRFTAVFGKEPLTLTESKTGADKFVGTVELSTGDLLTITSNTNLVYVGDTKEQNNTFDVELVNYLVDGEYNYEGLKSVFGTMTITPAPITITSKKVEWTYDGVTYGARTDVDHTYTVTFGSGDYVNTLEDVAVGKHELFADDEITITSTSDEKKFVADDGENSFDVAIVNANNYQEPVKTFGEMIINPAAAVVVSSLDKEWVYNGLEYNSQNFSIDERYTVTFGGVQQTLNANGTVRLSTGDLLTITSTTNVANVLDTAAGNNTFTYVLENERYNGEANYVSVDADNFGTLTVTKRNVTMTVTYAPGAGMKLHWEGADFVTMDEGGMIHINADVNAADSGFVRDMSGEFNDGIVVTVNGRTNTISYSQMPSLSMGTVLQMAGGAGDWANTNPLGRTNISFNLADLNNYNLLLGEFGNSIAYDIGAENSTQEIGNRPDDAQLLLSVLDSNSTPGEAANLFGGSKPSFNIAGPMTWINVSDWKNYPTTLPKTGDVLTINFLDKVGHAVTHTITVGRSAAVTGTSVHVKPMTDSTVPSGSLVFFGNANPWEELILTVGGRTYNLEPVAGGASYNYEDKQWTRTIDLGDIDFPVGVPTQVTIEYANIEGGNSAITIIYKADAQTPVLGSEIIEGSTAVWGFVEESASAQVNIKRADGTTVRVPAANIGVDQFGYFYARLDDMLMAGDKVVIITEDFCGNEKQITVDVAKELKSGAVAEILGANILDGQTLEHRYATPVDLAKLLTREGQSMKLPILAYKGIEIGTVEITLNDQNQLELNYVINAANYVAENAQVRMSTYGYKPSIEALVNGKHPVVVESLNEALEGTITVDVSKYAKDGGISGLIWLYTEFDIDMDEANFTSRGGRGINFYRWLTEKSQTEDILNAIYNEMAIYEDNAAYYKLHQEFEAI